MREIRVNDVVTVRTPTGDEKVGSVTEIEPNGTLVVEVTVTRATRYRRSPRLVELVEPDSAETPETET